MFNNGNEAHCEPPIMCWHYWEPRVITNVRVTPIPLANMANEGSYLYAVKDTKVFTGFLLAGILG